MKKMTILALFFTLFMPMQVMAQGANEADELSKRLVLAKEYFDIFPMDVEINEAIDELVLNVPKTDRVLFKTILQRHIKIPRIIAVSEMAMAETFTEAELKAMIAFYGTAEGKSIRAKMPKYREVTDPILDQMVADAVKSFENRVPTY